MGREKKTLQQKVKERKKLAIERTKARKGSFTAQAGKVNSEAKAKADTGTKPAGSDINEPDFESAFNPVSKRTGANPSAQPKKRKKRKFTGPDI
jgi:hypothetical protein